MAGRLRKHPNPLRETELFATQASLSEIVRTGTMTQTAIANAIAEFEDSDQFRNVSKNDFANCVFAMHDSTISNWLRNKTSISHWYAWAIFLWIKENFSHIIEKKLREETLKSKVRFVSIFNEMLGIGYPPEYTDTVSGTFQLYRPSFGNPDQEVMASILTIGSSESRFDCELRSEYQDRSGKNLTEHFRGKIVPEGDRMMCMLFVPKTHSTLIIHFHTIESENNDEGNISYMEGVMLAAAGTYPSSACPVFAMRPADGIEPKIAIIPASEFDNLPAGARDTLARGNVYGDAKQNTRSSVHKPVFEP